MVVTVGVTESEPLMALPVAKPVPVPVQLEALVEVQDNVAEAPVVIELGVAVRVTVGVVELFWFAPAENGTAADFRFQLPFL